MKRFVSGFFWAIAALLAAGTVAAHGGKIGAALLLCAALFVAGLCWPALNRKVF